MILIAIPVAIFIAAIWMFFELLRNDYRKYRKKNFEIHENAERPHITHK